MRWAMLPGGLLLAACTIQSGLETTPTFTAARYVPEVQPAPAVPSPAKPAAPIPHLSGAQAVAQANRTALVDPDATTMRGATWVIDDVQPSLIYRVRTALNRVTTILLPPGERFNGAVGGDVDDFLINVAYAGPRPAVSILPRNPQGRGNLQLVTTGGFYSFELLVNNAVAVNLVDVDRKARSATRTASLPQPQGDFTRLALHAVGGPMPGWAPVEAWADSDKMVVRFHGPLPTLPTLLAGSQGEQIVDYRSQSEGGEVYLITSRRVTEAELRLGGQAVRITVDPDGTGPGWQQAQPLPAQPTVLLVAPPPPTSVPADDLMPEISHQPMADHPIGRS